MYKFSDGEDPRPLLQTTLRLHRYMEMVSKIN